MLVFATVITLSLCLITGTIVRDIKGYKHSKWEKTEKYLNNNVYVNDENHN